MFWTMQNQARTKLLHRFDTNQYSSDELVVLSIPLNLPYPVESKGFDRVDGEFEYNDHTYQLVQRKFENDTVFLVCIKDVESTRIGEKLMDYVSITNDLPTGTKQAISVLGKLYKDYTTVSINFDVYRSVALMSTQISPEDLSFESRVSAVESPPPDVKA